jgi:hypothetical protein
MRESDHQHHTTHKPSGKARWASRMRENRTYGSYGEGLETDRGSHSAPRQPLTRQSLFARVERNLQSELATLAYPGAALFAFAVALVASNVFAVVHAAMTAAQKTHEDAKVAEMPLSDFAIVQEIRSVYGGMNMVLGDEPWRALQTKSAPQLAKLLLRWARYVRWPQFRKAVRGPKVTRKRSRFLDTPHVSTARLLGRA